MLSDKKPILSLSPFRGYYKAAVAISFDYETSAIYGDTASLFSKIRGNIHNIINRFSNFQKDLSFSYGLGYAMRRGTDNILNILRKYNVHATWFTTGHVLLKENKQRNAFRINQVLPYGTEKAGFTALTTWRKNFPTFFYEPYSDYKQYPYWYFGDQAEKLRESGEDIQCHTFSHPYIAMELPENVRIDIEDWQSTAYKNGFKTASILSFPYCGDAYRYYYDVDLKTMIGKDIPGMDYKIINLPNEIIDILRNNGVELLTRCGSKRDTYECFSHYDNSDLHFMSDIPCAPTPENFCLLEDRIKKIIDTKAAVDLWMHPSDVFTASEKLNFEMIIQYLIDKQTKNEIWLATIEELWDHFKKVKMCDLNISSLTNSKVEIAIKNNNVTSIENLSIDVNYPQLIFSQRNNNVEYRKGKLLIKKLPCGESYKLVCQRPN